MHIPILRRGRPYRSLDVTQVPDFRTRRPFVEMSQANVGLIRRDRLQMGSAQEALSKIRTVDLLAICRRASDLFATATLPLGDESQSPEDYVRQTAATTGLPFVMVRRNRAKVQGVLAEMATVLSGLTRGLDLTVLDGGAGEVAGHAVSFVPRGDSLGVVLPSNSPGVHSLWVQAVALKTPLILKPGGAEPWTPYRIVQALIQAGAPEEAFGYYPTDHAGAAEILRSCGRGMVFGDVSSTARWQADPRVEVHGPGFSKVVLGPDAVSAWPRDIDVVVASILENSGRSCVNASGVWVTGRAGEVAESLAVRLAAIRPRAAEDEAAELAPFANPRVAEAISASIDQGLAQGGARDVTAEHRDGPRVVTWEGATYLLPTIVHCESPDHPLANREFLFPFASVVEVEPHQLPAALGPSLVASVLTSDRSLAQRFLASPLVHRLNIGPIPTPRISWDQPHEGNLFDHLYVRRAFQRAPGAA